MILAFNCDRYFKDLKGKHVDPSDYWEAAEVLERDSDVDGEFLLTLKWGNKVSGSHLESCTRPGGSLCPHVDGVRLEPPEGWEEMIK